MAMANHWAVGQEKEATYQVQLLLIGKSLMCPLAKKPEDECLHHSLHVEAALALGVQVLQKIRTSTWERFETDLDPAHLTNCLDRSVSPDAIPGRLLLNKDLALSKLGEKVVVHCSVLVPLPGIKSVTSFMRSHLST